MLYTTLTFNGVEMSLADWNITRAARAQQNQARDEFSFEIIMPMDGAIPFPYGQKIIIQINRVASAPNPINPTAPNSVKFTPGLAFSGGTQWFVGYALDPDRVGEPASERLSYKLVGPYTWFFNRTIFQQMQVTWNGAEEISDWQSNIVLGMSLNVLTGAGDTIPDTTATNLFSIAQQVKQICMYAQQASRLAYGSNQFQCDQLTAEIDGVNWDLLETPSTNVLIRDYYGAPLSGKTSASMAAEMLVQPGVAPGIAGSYILRPTLDAVNAITCDEALQRVLVSLGGIGSPLVWTDHSTTPPTLRLATPDEIYAPGGNPADATVFTWPFTGGTVAQRMTGAAVIELPLSGITVKQNIKRLYDLVPTAVHFKYKINGSYFGQPNQMVINDVAAYLVTATGAPGVPGAAGVELYEGIGSWGELYDINNPTTLLSGTIQDGLMAAALLPGAMIQTIDLQGNQVNGQQATITVSAINPVDPAGTGADGGWWTTILPHLVNTTGLQFFDGSTAPVTYTDPQTGEAVDVTGLGNMLPDGQLAPWMASSGEITIKKVRVTGYFNYTEKLVGSNTINGNYVSNKEEHRDITLTNATSGTYENVTGTIQGEPIPYGFAGYICALESRPMYDGKIVVQETEITGVAFIGNLLNITQGPADWATMNAVIQDVRFNHDLGQTEITIGPAKHMTTAQFLARMKSNIGPRWYLTIRTNPTNANDTGNDVPANIAAMTTGAGAKNFGTMQMFTNLPEAQAAGGYDVPPGIMFDAGQNANPGGFPQGQQIVVSDGTSASDPAVRLAKDEYGTTITINGTLDSMTSMLEALEDGEDGQTGLSASQLQITGDGKTAPSIADLGIGIASDTPMILLSDGTVDAPDLDDCGIAIGGDTPNIILSNGSDTINGATADIAGLGEAKFRQLTFCQTGTNYTAKFWMTTPVAT